MANATQATRKTTTKRAKMKKTTQTGSKSGVKTATSKNGATSKPVITRSGKPAVEPTLLNQEQIATRAYQIWIDHGKPIGQDDLNWAQAETELCQAA